MNESKTILQIACLVVLLIVLIIAGAAFFRFYNVLGDFRDSFIFQPVAPDGLARLESLVTGSSLEEIRDLLPLEQGVVPGRETEDLQEIDNLEIPGLTGDAVEEEPEGESSIGEPGVQPSTTPAALTVAEVDTRNICGRTPEIQQLLIEMLQITRCRDITGEELLRVRELELRNMPLKVGDLDGFKNLTSLTLLSNEVSVGLFDDLVSLEYLGLGLEVPPSTGIFRNLVELQELELFVDADDDAEDLVLQGMFEGLIALESLTLGISNDSDDYAVALLPGSFAGMPKLQELEVSQVSRVDSDILSDLPELRSAMLEAIDLPGHLTKPSLPSNIFLGNPDLGSINLSGFRDVSSLEFNSLNVVCRMQRSMDLMYGVDFATVVKGEVVEVVDYDWDDETIDCTLRVAPVGTENWEQVEVNVPPLSKSRRG